MVNAKGVTAISGEIYDRWGLQVFTFQAIDEAWDGRTTSGVPVSDGTYYYIVRTTGYDGTQHVDKGYLLLTR